VTELGFTKTLG